MHTEDKLKQLTDNVRDTIISVGALATEIRELKKRVGKFERLSRKVELISERLGVKWLMTPEELDRALTPEPKIQVGDIVTWLGPINTRNVIPRARYGKVEGVYLVQTNGDRRLAILAFERGECSHVAVYESALTLVYREPK